MTINSLLRVRPILSILIAGSLLLAGTTAMAAYLTNVPQTVTQPSGMEIDCFASGDEYYSWLHDEGGYVIVKDPDSGYYVYAVKSGDDIVASEYVVGKVSPKEVGLTPNIMPSAEKLQEYRLSAFGDPTDVKVAAPQLGTINNIVIFIRFSDDGEYTDSFSTYYNEFNASTSGANSMYNYFKETSYNQLSVSTTFYPNRTGSTVVSYQDSHPRAYYTPYDAASNPTGYSGDTEKRIREHSLLASAVNAVAAQVPTSLNLDGDGDGNVDNVCFIVKGSPTAWNTLLWPHKWSLSTYDVYINQKCVYTYNLQLQSGLSAGAGVGVLCHEMFHSLGAPDLYHYTNNGISPCYTWDIMCSNPNPPAHMSAYMKWKYGKWISSIPQITQPGVYTLGTLKDSTNCYKIASPNSSTEYFVVEFRKREGTFENTLPGSGLLVYRINSSCTGNANGPPDEVYLYRPNGTTTNNGIPSSAAFSSNVGRTIINDSTNPSCFLTNGGPGGLSISDIRSYDGSTISFWVGGIKISPPTFSLASGNYSGAQLVSISTTVADPIIRYTIDGSDPTETNGFTYTGPMVIDSSVTIKARAYKTDYVPSDISTASYIITAIPMNTDVAAVKILPDYSNVNFESILVTAVFSGYIYVEAEDRSAGIRVDKTSFSAVPGNRVRIAGVMRTNSDGERYIAATEITPTGGGTPRPLAMNNRWVGGGNWQWTSASTSGQRGVEWGFGLNNIGLLVRTTGKFTYINSYMFMVDDGSGTPVPCMALYGAALDPNWQYVVVTGVSSCYKSGSVLRRLIRIQCDEDIIPLM